VVAAAGAFTQSVWRAKTHPSALQILFNMAAVALGGAASYGAYTAVMGTGPLNYEISAGAFAAAVYWTVNTGLVSCVLTLLNDGSFWDLWGTWSIWSLPYYLTSAALTIPIGNWAYRGQWRPAFLLASVIVLVTIWFRVWVRRDAPAR
jgi:hypothetical protein